MDCTDDLMGVSDPHIIDPFPVLAGLQAQAPIVPVDIREHLGGTPSMVGAGGAVYTTLTYEACAHVLQHPESFSSSLTKYTLGLSMGRTMLELDPPEHTANRNLVATAFRPRQLERWVETVVRPTARDLVGEAAAEARRTGSVELVRRVAVRLPMMVISRILGLPDTFLPQFEDWAVAIIRARLDPEGSVAAAAAFSDYCRDVVDQRRRQPSDDLVSRLVTAEVDGLRLTDDEVLSFMKLLFPAGAETTYRSIGTMLHALVHHPDQLAAIRADRLLIRAAIEESLRWQPTVGASSPRVAVDDAVVFGVDVPAGSTIIAGYAVANRDPARWEHPERFDVHRPHRPHIAFGSGPHTCLGLHLAHAEMREVLEAALDLLPGMCLDEDAPEQHVHGIVMRGPCAVPVRLAEDA